MKINNKVFNLTLDTGAEVSLISERIWTLLGKPALTAPTVKLTLADGRPLDLVGTLQCSVDLNGSKFRSECHVTQSCELLGLDWIKRDPSLREIFENVTPKKVQVVKRLRESAKTSERTSN